MKIEEAQNKVKEILGDIEHPRLASFIALTEEVGEVANEVLRKEIYEETTDINKLKDEISDVFVSLLELANVYQIDLTKEFQRKIENLEPRAKEWTTIAKDLLKKKREKHD